MGNGLRSSDIPDSLDEYSLRTVTAFLFHKSKKGELRRAGKVKKKIAVMEIWKKNYMIVFHLYRLDKSI